MQSVIPAKYVFSRPLVFASIPKLEPRRAGVQAFPWGRLTVEAATRFPSILSSGSLIPIVVYWDGDGFPLAKHVLCRDDSANRSV
jgi:hypothetical protein